MGDDSVVEEATAKWRTTRGNTAGRSVDPCRSRSDDDARIFFRYSRFLPHFSLYAPNSGFFAEAMALRQMGARGNMDLAALVSHRRQEII